MPAEEAADAHYFEEQEESKFLLHASNNALGRQVFVEVLTPTLTPILKFLTVTVTATLTPHTPTLTLTLTNPNPNQVHVSTQHH